MHLDVHLVQRLLHPLHEARPLTHQIAQMPLQSPQAGNRLARTGRAGCGATSALRIAFSVTFWSGRVRAFCVHRCAPSAWVADSGRNERDFGDEEQLARSLHSKADADAGIAVRQGAGMAKERDVYTTIGPAAGCCGHRHRSVWKAGRCLVAFRRQEFSDRRVVAVAADAPWPPTEGRDLNAAELDALYADADAVASSDEHQRLVVFAAGIAGDIAALRRVADVLHHAWAEGGLGRDTTEDAEIAAASCRAIGLGLATVERTADCACAGRLRSR